MWYLALCVTEYRQHVNHPSCFVCSPHDNNIISNDKCTFHDSTKLRKDTLHFMLTLGSPATLPNHFCYHFVLHIAATPPCQSSFHQSPATTTDTVIQRGKRCSPPWKYFRLMMMCKRTSGYITVQYSSFFHQKTDVCSGDMGRQLSVAIMGRCPKAI